MRLEERCKTRTASSPLLAWNTWYPSSHRIRAASRLTISSSSTTSRVSRGGSVTACASVVVARSNRNPTVPGIGIAACDQSSGARARLDEHVTRCRPQRGGHAQRRSRWAARYADDYAQMEEIRRCRVSQDEVTPAHASSDGAPCSSQLLNTADDCARCQSERTSSAIARSGPLGVSLVTQRLSSHCSYVSGSGSCCTVSSSRVRFKDMPMASGVVSRLRLRRRPSEASRALRSWLHSSAGRTIDDLELQRESSVLRAIEASL
jgi:hypothetical protein